MDRRKARHLQTPSTDRQQQRKGISNTSNKDEQQPWPDKRKHEHRMDKHIARLMTKTNNPKHEPQQCNDLATRMARHKQNTWTSTRRDPCTNQSKDRPQQCKHKATTKHTYSTTMTRQKAGLDFAYAWPWCCLSLFGVVGVACARPDRGPSGFEWLCCLAMLWA